jgi:hypothetical protein
MLVKKVLISVAGIIATIILAAISFPELRDQIINA